MPDTPLIVTPTARLANALGRAAAERLVEQAPEVRGWLRPRVMAWPTWIKQLLDDWLLETDDVRVPLTGQQAQAIWAQIIGHDIFLSAHRVARQARRSWEHLHQWCLPGPADWPRTALNEDTRQFQRWALAWTSRLEDEGWLDPVAWQATLPERIGAGEIPLPDTLTLHGFELPADPLQQRIIEALEVGGVVVERAGSRSSLAEPVVIAADDPQSELELAACWARARYEAGARRVAIVVPDLEARLADVDRVLRRALAPDTFALMADRQVPWHVSLGPAVSQWPLAADALRVLNSAPGRLDLLEFGALLRSPYLAGWNTERHARAVLDARLRKLPGDQVTLFRVGKEIGDSIPELTDRLQAWQTCHEQSPERAVPSVWAEQFAAELETLGFARGRPTGSVEYQLLEAWQAVLEQLAALDSVTGPENRRQALDRLAELAAGRTFREQNPGAPIEVLGVYEALGGQFDAIRVLGLDEASWPPPARPDPLLPRRLQAGRPEATPAGQLEQAGRILAGLARTAPEVVFSWPRTREDATLSASRLLWGSMVDESLPPHSPAAMLDEAVDDSNAPPHPGGDTRGGTGLLKSQSECPFKAFAAYRLAAEELRHPRPGLDALARGSLLHDVLERFWKTVHDSTALQALVSGENGLSEGEQGLAGDQREFDTVVQDCCRYAVSALLDTNRLALTPAQATIEVQRLATRLRDWLELERQRPPFRVAQVERWLELDIGGLSLRGKLDRADALADGRLLLIDYKSGEVETRGWYPEPRLRDPQLPLYCLSMAPRPAAIAFACLRPDQLGWKGLADQDPGVSAITALADTQGKFTDIDDWDGLLGGWSEHLCALAEDFRAGNAPVDPRDTNVCKYCHLGALCRVRERTPA